MLLSFHTAPSTFFLLPRLRTCKGNEHENARLTHCFLFKTSTRPRNQPPNGHRARHAPQISLSDENHHVTDAISSLYHDYGDQPTPHQQQQQQRQRQQQQQQAPTPPQYPQQPKLPDNRPLSFLPSVREEISRPSLITAGRRNDNPRSFSQPRPPSLSRAVSDQTPNSTAAARLSNSHHRTSDALAEPAYANGQAGAMVGRSNTTGHGVGAAAVNGGSTSPTLPSPAETANAKFPLANIDYESSPAAVAQELSNLQAIRRMSMDVNVAGDPDLPGFGSIPTMAPTGAADEDDASRLFWVPARLHPELAPKEFKTFLDGRVDRAKRKSAEFSAAPDGPSRSGSSSGLRRKKSMLSRQIDNSNGRAADGYQDGAERLERKRSQGNKVQATAEITNLHELEEMLNDPSQVIHRLSLDASQRATGGEVPADEDMPILPAPPGGGSLRRSTRTTYGRGSLKKGERVPPSKRAPRLSDADVDDGRSPSPLAPSTSAEPPMPTISRIQTEPPMAPISRVQTEPTPPLGRIVEKQTTENFSRPHARGSMRNRAPPPSTSPPPASSPTPVLPPVTTSGPPTSFDSIFAGQQQSPSPIESPDRISSPPSPQTSPPSRREPKPFVSQIASNGRSTLRIGRDRVPSIVETPPADEQPSSPPNRQPQRSPESHTAPHGSFGSGASAPPLRSAKRSQLNRAPAADPTANTLQHMATHPSPLPGNSTRTDNLAFIPTLPEEQRTSSDSIPRKEPPAKKSGWSLSSLLGSEEREKEKKREEEAKDASRKAKSRLGKPANNDNTRLDVLQTTMEGGSSSPRGRESLVLDRGDPKLDEERKKESARKGPEVKKEKDGFLGSLFGGSKKRPAKDAQPSPGSAGSDGVATGKGKKHAGGALRSHSPAEPPRAPLRPDVDYNWTRFSILEERAIYRMAHIKLANPRRSLYSQVLLSNFMYSYLAKVQQMHPQMSIPQTAAQKAQQRAAHQQMQAQQQQQQQQQKKESETPEEYYQYQRYQEVRLLAK